MKGSILLFLLLLATMGMAQNRSIAFEETKEWQEITAKARKAGKMIFVDCFTSWCGPCKMLATKVFTNDAVADYFNEHFVSAKFDMEKDKDGMAHKKAWDVTAFPTLLFIDPQSGGVVEKLVGFRPAEALLESARSLVNLNKSAADYSKNSRNAEAVLQMVVSLKRSGKEQEALRVMGDYFIGMTPQQMATPEGWAIIFQCADDILTPPLKTVYENKALFAAIPGKDQARMVEAKLNQSVLQKAVQFATNPNLAIWDQEGFNAFVSFLDTFTGETRPMAAVWLNTSAYARGKQWDKVLEAVNAVYQNKIMTGRQAGQYLYYFMTEIGKSGEKGSVDMGIAWLDGMVGQVSGEDRQAYYKRAVLSEVKWKLCDAAGKLGLAKKAQKELQLYSEKLKEFDKKQ